MLSINLNVGKVAYHKMHLSSSKSAGIIFSILLAKSLLLMKLNYSWEIQQQLTLSTNLDRWCALALLSFNIQRAVGLYFPKDKTASVQGHTAIRTRAGCQTHISSMPKPTTNIFLLFLRL